jgi:hypothetical protein
MSNQNKATPLSALSPSPRQCFHCLIQPNSKNGPFTYKDIFFPIIFNGESKLLCNKHFIQAFQSPNDFSDNVKFDAHSREQASKQQAEALAKKSQPTSNSIL